MSAGLQFMACLKIKYMACVKKIIDMLEKRKLEVMTLDLHIISKTSMLGWNQVQNHRLCPMLGAGFFVNHLHHSWMTSTVLF